MKNRLHFITIFCFIAILFIREAVGQNYAQMTNLPTIYINTVDNKPIVSKEDYIDATLYYVDETGVKIYTELEIRGRGNSTWGLEKKPYRIKFEKNKFLWDRIELMRKVGLYWPILQIKH